MKQTQSSHTYPDKECLSFQAKPLPTEISESRTKISKELAKEKKVPRGVSLEAFDLLFKSGGHKEAFPSKEETYNLILFCCKSQINRWYFQKLPIAKREKFVYSPSNKLEAYIESTVEGMIVKGKRISLNQITHMVSFYFKIPEPAARAIAKRITHRVRVRHRLFLSPKNADKMFRKFHIPPGEFSELAKVGIIRPTTPNHVLETIGKILQHYHHGSSRLWLTKV